MDFIDIALGMALLALFLFILDRLEKRISGDEQKKY